MTVTLANSCEINNNVLFYVYRFYSTKYATEREMGRADDENALKRLIRRRLGPRCVIFFIHGFFHTYYCLFHMSLPNKKTQYNLMLAVKLP